MLKANLKIILALKTFLHNVSSSEELKNHFRLSITAFTRNRKLTFDRLVLLIMKLCKKSLSVELEKYFSELNLKTTCSVAAFSMQRLKLNPSFFISWNIVLWKTFYQEQKGRVKRWKGLRVLGCDGSSTSLVNRPCLSKYFGGQSNRHCSYVIAKTFYCFDVLNKLVLYSSIAPYRYGEFQMACDMINRSLFEGDMLLIFDRHYSSYRIAFLFMAQETQAKFLIRVNENYNFSKCFIESKKTSTIIDLFPSDPSIKELKRCGYKVKKNQSIKVRLIKVKLPGGKIEILMTNLWEEDGYPSNEFKNLYAMRWGVETNIDFQKNILQLESSSGLTPVSVIQDFYATVFVSNLHTILTMQAQEIINQTKTDYKYPLRVNNNKAFGKIKENLIPLFITKTPIEILKTLTSYFVKSPLPVRINRSFPRVRKNQQTRSKHRTFTNYKPTY